MNARGAGGVFLLEEELGAQGHGPFHFVGVGVPLEPKDVGRKKGVLRRKRKGLIQHLHRRKATLPKCEIMDLVITKTMTSHLRSITDCIRVIF